MTLSGFCSVMVACLVMVGIALPVGSPVYTNLRLLDGNWFDQVQTGSGWTQNLKLLAVDGTGSTVLGYAIAISGSTLVKGAK